MKLNIGCGKKEYHLQGYINVDIKPVEGAVYGDILDLKYSDNYFEEIICNDVLEHVTDPPLAVSEMYRVLKPGGYVDGNIPYLHPIHSKQDYWRFTKQGIEELFKDYSKVYVTRTTGFFGVLAVFTGRLKPIFNWLDRRYKLGNNATQSYGVMAIK